MSEVYEVSVTREGRRWTAEVVGLPGADAQARSLVALVKHASEAIRRVQGLPDDEEVEVRLAFTGDLAAIRDVIAIADQRRRLDAELRALQVATLEAVFRLRAESFSARDIAALIGITPGRVSQLLGPRKQKGPAKRARA